VQQWQDSFKTVNPPSTFSIQEDGKSNHTLHFRDLNPPISLTLAATNIIETKPPSAATARLLQNTKPSVQIHHTGTRRREIQSTSEILDSRGARHRHDEVRVHIGIDEDSHQLLKLRRFCVRLRDRHLAPTNPLPNPQTLNPTPSLGSVHAAFNSSNNKIVHRRSDHLEATNSARCLCTFSASAVLFSEH
jgi:hypothetical protein